MTLKYIASIHGWYYSIFSASRNFDIKTVRRAIMSMVFNSVQTRLVPMIQCQKVAIVEMATKDGRSTSLVQEIN